MILRRAFISAVSTCVVLGLVGCGGDDDGVSDGAVAVDGGGGGGRDGGGGGGADGATGVDGGGGGGRDGGGGPAEDGGTGSMRAIGEWTDAPGACPAGTTRVDITTVAEMEDASRGDAHTEGTCFFVHDGVYTQRGGTLPLYFQRSGTASAPIVWVGESRDGVIVHGRATFEASDVELRNMTFDLAGYSQSGSFNTITVLGDRITLSHLTLTGDCATGLRGGHVEVDGGAGETLVEACIVERFGQCSGDGHLDHGIYLAAGHDITIRNNVIRENSSRGIQLNTEGGAFGTLSNVTIERNRIHDNGNRDYEDGIVLNGAGSGTIDGVTIRHNLFWSNRYSGVRLSGDAMRAIAIENNTFVRNGAMSSGANRSEVNLDDGTPMLSVTRNVFVPARTVINGCAAEVTVGDNVVLGDAAGGCVSGTVAADPMFADEAAHDYRPTNPAVMGYGAYAP